MARAKVVDFDYYQFLGLMRRATDAGKRIDKADGKRWADYIKAHAINEVAATAIARWRCMNSRWHQPKRRTARVSTAAAGPGPEETPPERRFGRSRSSAS